jgi:hypothetical protein
MPEPSKKKLKLSKESRFKPLPLARKALANRLYSTIEPDVYGDIETVKGKIGDFLEGTPRSTTQEQYSEDAWAKYLGLEQPGGTISRQSKYRPEIETNKRSKYHRLPDEFEQALLQGYKQNKSYIQSLSDDPSKMPMSEQMMPGSMGRVLGNFTVGEGVDEETGERYLSYYDKYDIAPNPVEGIMGSPFEFYNRIPLPNEEMSNDNNLPEYENGGSIYIKPSKRGSLREALGTPKGKNIPASDLAIKDSDSEAMRKKKQFAINARKWNKEHGGSLEMLSTLAGGEQIDPLNYIGLPEYGFGSWLKENAGGLLKGASSLVKGIPLVGDIAGGIFDLAGSVVGAVQKNKADKAAAEAEQARLDEEAAAQAEVGRQKNLALRTESIVDKDQASYASTFETGGDLLLNEEEAQFDNIPQITEYSQKANSHDEGIGGIPVDARGNPATTSKSSVVGLTEAGEVTWNGYVFSDKLKVNKK